MSLYPAQTSSVPYDVQFGRDRYVADERQREYDSYRTPAGSRPDDAYPTGRPYPGTAGQDGRDDRGYGRDGGYGRDRGDESREPRGYESRGYESRDSRGYESRDSRGYESRGYADRDDRDRGYPGRDDRDRGYPGRDDRDRGTGSYGRDRGTGSYGRDDRDRGYGRDDRDRGYGRDDRGRDDRGRDDRARDRDERARDRGYPARDDRDRGRRPSRAPEPKDTGHSSKRAPLLIRGTLAAAALLALAASIVRAVGMGPAGNGQATLVLGQGTTASAIQTAGAAPTQYVGVGQTVGGTDTPAAAAAVTAVSCHVQYSVTARSATKFTAAVTISNNGASPIQGWTLRWKYPAKTRLSGGWNAEVTTDTNGALAKGAGANRVIPAGGSATIGFVGTLAAGTGAGAADPTQPASGFSLNGVMCR